IETRWGLAPLGTRDAAVNDLRNAFEPTAGLGLPRTGTDADLPATAWGVRALFGVLAAGVIGLGAFVALGRGGRRPRAGGPRPRAGLPVENQKVENQKVENQKVENQKVENQKVENQKVENQKPVEGPVGGARVRPDSAEPARPRAPPGGVPRGPPGHLRPGAG